MRKLGMKSNLVSRWEKGRQRVLWSDFVALSGVCRVDLGRVMSLAYGYEGDLADSSAEVRHILKVYPDSPDNPSEWIPRTTLVRWSQGEAILPLGQLLKMLAFEWPVLFDFFEGLGIGPSDLPSIEKSFQRNRDYKSLIVAYPWLSWFGYALRLKTYRSLETHEPGLIASALGITRAQEEEGIQRLLEAGFLTWKGRKLVADTPEYCFRTNLAELSKRREYLIKRVVGAFEGAWEKDPWAFQIMQIPMSHELARKLRVEYLALVSRYTRKIQEEKESDGIYLFGDLLLDLSKTKR